MSKRKLKILIPIFLSSLILVLRLITAPPALAVCPVCTVAVVGGLGLSRWLGVDDTVSGVWVGGLILSSSFWLAEWLQKKFRLKSKFKYTTLLVTLIVYLLVLLPLFWTNTIGHPFNTLWGIDKLIVGTTIGSILFLAGVWTDKKEREIKGEILFNFQRVVFPVTALVIASLVMYFLTKV